MTGMQRRRHQALSWLVGLLVLVALSAAVTWMLNKGGRVSETSRPWPVKAADLAMAEPPRLINDVERADLSDGVLVQGLVVTPNDLPVAGATVALYRLVTGWPEWRRERVDEAITRDDGAFQFRCPHLHGFLVWYDHPEYAGGYEEVSQLGDEMRLRLSPGFEIEGFVLNDVGAPVPNARVSIESVLGEQRRASHTQTSADGSYRFSRLAAGPARLVARHATWQPVRASALVIGDRKRADLRFDRPSMSPLRGRVLSTSTQAPIAGALVQVIPLSDSIGLSDPIATTTDANGTFLLGGLPSGSMRLWVRHDDYGVSRSTQTIGASGNDVAIELPDLTRVAGVLQGVGPDVFTGGETLMMRDAGNALAFTTVQADGSFTFDRAVSPGPADIRVLGGAFSFRSMKATVWNTVLEEAPANELEIKVVPAAVVRGRLVNANGEPVEDVVLTRTQWLVDTVAVLGNAAWMMDFGKVGDGLMQLVDVVRDEPLARSAADGTFEIRGYRRGGMVARVACAGCGSRLLNMQVPDPGKTADLGDIVLAPGCSISGRVVRGGRPFVGATVTVISDSCQSLAITDGDGRFMVKDLEPGEYQVKGRLSDRPTGQNMQVVTVGLDSPVRDVMISLDVGRVVGGIIQDMNGQPLAGALISIRGRPGQVISSRSDGRFNMELPDRDVELVVSYGDRTQQKIVPVPASSSPDELTIALDRPPSATLVARIAGLPGRRAVPGVLLRLTELGGTADAGVQTRYIDTLGGDFRRDQVPTGRVKIEIWSDGYAPLQLERELQADEELDLGEILLAPGASLRGIVQDMDGNAVSGAMVLLGAETDFDLFVPSVRSGPDGMFTIQGVTSQSRHMIVRAPGFAAQSVDLELPRDVLSPDPFVVRLGRGATIEVVVTGDGIPEDRVVYLRRNNALLQSTVLDERGKAWFSNRGVGRYSVSLLGSSLPAEVVDVKHGDAVLPVRFDVGSK